MTTINNLDAKTLAENSDALCVAARDGELENVRRLLPVSDPNAYNYQALTWASYYKYTDILLELIPVSDIGRAGVLQKLLNQAAANSDGNQNGDDNSETTDMVFSDETKKRKM